MVKKKKIKYNEKPLWNSYRCAYKRFLNKSPKVIDNFRVFITNIISNAFKNLKSIVNDFAANAVIIVNAIFDRIVECEENSSIYVVKRLKIILCQ